MAIALVGPLGNALRRGRLLELAQLTELPGLEKRFPEPRALARELIQRNWLTPYQVNQVLQGRAQELTVGQYVLLERLGEGGMGQVFKARHRSLDRVAALKVIRKDRLANPTALRRFQREIQVVAQLSHPNVLRAFDAAEVNGTHFFAMGYVDGIDLTRMVRDRGPLAIEQACDYSRQAGDGRPGQAAPASDRSSVQQNPSPSRS
jgi:serine/threonine protein kinase